MDHADLSNDVRAVGRLTAVPKILHAVAHLTGMRFAAVARVTESRWIACAVHDALGFGLQPGGELELETTLCNEIRQHQQPLVFGQASLHPDFATHPCPRLYGFESYISIPIIRTDGRFFGTLCALDPLPSKLDEPAAVRTLELFADLIAAQLDIEDRLQSSDDALCEAAGNARLRDQFVAVLGHDLRSPLAAMAMGVDVLREAPLPTRWSRHLDRMQRSCERMGELIGNVLDLARGQLGGGIVLHRSNGDRLLEQLTQVVSEVSSNHPTYRIDADLRIDRSCDCDENRIAQLLSNLLNNAVIHGASDAPVSVLAETGASQFLLSVRNGGHPIPEAVQQRLFEPFWRGTGEQGGAELAMGLGLGLYIATEIAKAHAGTLEVTSNETGTCFTFRMPCAKLRSDR